ncbi:MAG: Dabb family protein [Gammaproteobacteria bacterium]|nr:MAG: Dabb family protein [Gammaproteobacteria bacterium]
MIRHVVMWRVKPTGEHGAGENAARLRDALLALEGRIPELLEIEAGVNELEGDEAMDVVLIASFADYAALERYQKHPAHLEVAELVKAIRTERRAVDFSV